MPLPDPSTPQAVATAPIRAYMLCFGSASQRRSLRWERFHDPDVQKSIAAVRRNLSSLVSDPDGRSALGVQRLTRGADQATVRLFECFVPRAKVVWFFVVATDVSAILLLSLADLRHTTRHTALDEAFLCATDMGRLGKESCMPSEKGHTSSERASASPQSDITQAPPQLFMMENLDEAIAAMTQSTRGMTPHERLLSMPEHVFKAIVEQRAQFAAAKERGDKERMAAIAEFVHDLWERPIVPSDCPVIAEDDFERLIGPPGDDPVAG